MTPERRRRAPRRTGGRLLHSCIALGLASRHWAAMHALSPLLVLLPLAAARASIEPIIDGVLRGEAVLVASPAPEPEPKEKVHGHASSAAARAVVARAHKGPKGTLSIPLEHEHRARALSHSGQNVCLNDCPNGPGVVGNIVRDGYCDDGAPSTAYCADPNSEQCSQSVTSWCPFGHDCDDCGPRIVANICTCCAVSIPSLTSEPPFTTVQCADITLACIRRSSTTARQARNATASHFGRWLTGTPRRGIFRATLRATASFTTSDRFRQQTTRTIVIVIRWSLSRTAACASAGILILYASSKHSRRLARMGSIQ